MKTMFIEARHKGKIRLPVSAIRRLPDRIGLFTTVQFIGSIENIAEQLTQKGKTVRLFKPKHARYKGQILGCSIKRFSGVDAFLYIGDGLFHPIALALKNNKPVFTYNPFSKQFTELDQVEMKRCRNRQNAALKRFYMSDNIGILVSTKPGQNRMKQALGLKQKLKKNCYILVSDEIDLQSLENFPFIECFVNTACPRISYDDCRDISKPIIEIDQL